MDLAEHMAMVLEIDQQKRFAKMKVKYRFLDDPFEIEIFQKIVELRNESKTYIHPIITY
jgi:hypothetical protein